MAVPILCMEVAIVTNVLHKQFFYCNEQGQYVHGKAYLVTYIFTLICIAAVIINCFINQEEYQKNELRAIKEFLGVALVCVTIQMKFQSVLMTGFGLSLGITILFWALYNPQLYIDSLTGLYSKGYFRRWFPEQIKRKKELHLLMIDLWKLKQVNKLYGVTTGDELLIQIAEYLHKINEANHVFRIHGNRFFVFTTSLMDYETNKDAIMKLFKRPFKVKGERISFSAAICGIINVQEVKEIDVLIDYLEYLVQLKPKSDRTILIQNDQHTKEGFLYEQEVKKYMATAIEEDLFEVYYQPIVDCVSGRVIGAEALMRYTMVTEEGKEWLSPVEFIPLLEKTGLIIPAGRFVLDEAAKMCREIQQYIPEFSVNVNISCYQIEHGKIADKILTAVRDNGLTSDRICIEMTESGFMDMTPVFCKFRKVLEENGIQFVIDDFGTGYSNLHCISDMNPGYVKMDKDFTAKAMSCERDYELFKKIIEMVHSIGIRICVEGIEKEDWHLKMKELQADYLQGYFFGKPCEKKKFMEEFVCNPHNNGVW